MYGKGYVDVYRGVKSGRRMMVRGEKERREASAVGERKGQEEASAFIVVASLIYQSISKAVFFGG